MNVMPRGVLRITSAGFQFLLHSPHDQLWDLLLQYFNLAEVSGCLMRLLELILRPRNGKWTWLRFWGSFSCCQQWNSARHCSLYIHNYYFTHIVLGILYRESQRYPEGHARRPSWLRIDMAKKGMFMNFIFIFVSLLTSPSSQHHGASTPLALQLLWHPLLYLLPPPRVVVPVPKKDSLFLKLITVYTPILVSIFPPRVFVFTIQLLTSCVCVENPLQTAVLNLFVSLKYRFPNLVVGSITRESVRKALANGITADQVC